MAVSTDSPIHSHDKQMIAVNATSHIIMNAAHLQDKNRLTPEKQMIFLFDKSPKHLNSIVLLMFLYHLLSKVPLLLKQLMLRPLKFTSIFVLLTSK
jgi:hypothetical protein